MDSGALTRIGPDEVVVADDGIVILSPADMPWHVREFCRVPIWHGGTKYYLRDKRFDETRRRFIYDLRHWPADHPQESSEVIDYDVAYVAARDEHSAAARNRQRVHDLLLFCYPFLGFLWSDYKNRTLGRLGFVPDSITRASVFVGYIVCVVTGIFVGWLGFRDSLVMWAVMVVSGVDTLLRFSQSLRLDVQRHWGFLEWLFDRGGSR